MSEGTVFQRADGRWCAKWKDAHSNWRYLYRKGRREAKQALRAALKDRDEGITPASKMTVAALLKEWLEDTNDTVSYRTWVNHRGIVRLHLEPAIGSERLARLTPKDVHDLHRSKLAEGLSPVRVRKIHVTLNCALKDAVRWQYIPRNPATIVTPPQERQREINVLLPEQVKRLLNAARGDRLECAYVLAAVCALRISEVAGVRWDDIDLGAGTLKIRRTVWRNRVNPTKTRSSRRTLILPKIAIGVLKRHGHDADGWLLQTRNGNPIDPSNIHYPWKRLLAKAGLPQSTRYHDLRGSAGSFLLAQGVPLPVVSRFLGHSNSSITLRHYIGVVDGMEGMAANGRDETLGWPSDAP
jgi:integrase